MLSDSEFRYQFENKTLPSAYFDHIGHLRIAWLYLQEFKLTEASQRVGQGIKDYAESLGAKDKFHYTLTEATVRIIASRLNKQNSQSFNMFLENNPDVVSDLKSVIKQYYSDKLLNSEQAKLAYYPPDL